MYVRTDERTRYVTIGPGTQASALLATAAFLTWTGFASYAYVDRAMDGKSAQTRLETMQEAYEARLAASDEQRRSLELLLHEANLRRDTVTARLSEKQARLVDTANSLQEAQAELGVLHDRFAELTAERRRDATRFARLEDELAGLRGALAKAETTESNLDGAFDVLGTAMDNVIAERDKAVGEMARLGGEVDQLSGRIDMLKAREQHLLAQLEEAAQTSLAGLDTLFQGTNIYLGGVLDQARRDYTGAGGPFVPAIDGADESLSEAQPSEERIAALMKDIETVSLMRFAAERLPFGRPVSGGRYTSGFGNRIDPKGRGRAFHAGLDIAGPRGTPIYATAEGVVTFAGRQRGYGIVVKIRHAFGFETVYAHLSRAHVKVGQRVDRGQRIADMGSTGRSTGTHLHYEVRIDNEPVNPVKFIEAARDVL